MYHAAEMKSCCGVCCDDESGCSQLGRQHSKVNTSSQTATVSVTIFNITKNCVGSTVLAAPDALQFAGSVPLFLSIMVLNIILHSTTYALMTVGCARTGARSFRDWWLAVNGSRGIVALDVLLFINGLTSLIAYVILIGDFLTKSFEGLFPSLTFLHSRVVNVWFATLVALLPLSLLRDLSSLVHASKLGLACALYSAVFVTLDFVSSGRPFFESIAPSAFINANADPMSAIGLLISSAGSEVLTPKLFAELKEGTPKKYTMASIVAEVFAHCFYIAFGIMGYARFGPSPPREDGNLLANYSRGSCWELFAWLGMAVNTVGMYPLQFAPVRDSAIGFARMLRQGRHREEKTSAALDDVEFRLCTVTLVVLSVILALQGVGLATINLVKGVFIMPLLCFVIPMCLYTKSAGDHSGDWTHKCSWILFIIGLLVMMDGPCQLFARYSPGAQRQAPLSLRSGRIHVENVPHETFGTLD
mmetsp:Transcript_54794/g.138418  ORF Transcript_54794/g.138418 Transcript_54794/m.138418 type:complete len:474 (-) Transcript_54794:86-1507(-)